MVFLGATRAVSLQSAKLRIPSIKFRKGGLASAGHVASGASAAPQVRKLSCCVISYNFRSS